MEYFPVRTRRPPQDFSPGLAAMASHPGALTAFGPGTNGQGRDIHIDPQQALGEPMVRGLAITLEVILRHPLDLGHVLSRTGLQRAGDGRLVRAALPPKGPLDSRIDADGDIAL
jgi:hypothetical protein